MFNPFVPAARSLRQRLRASAVLAGAFLLLTAYTRSGAQSLVLQLTPSGYNASTRVLTPDVSSVSGLKAAAEGTPLVVPNATPGGQSAFSFDGASAFDFTATGPYSQNTTIFAVIQPNLLVANNTTGGNSIAGGAPQVSIEYRLNSSFQQNILLNQRQDLGHSTTAVPTTAFSVVELVYDQDTNTSNFYLNGVLDPAAGTANNDGSGLSRFAATQLGQGGTTDYFNGKIAALYQYNDALTSAQSATVNGQLIATYLTPAAPEPAGAGLLGLASLGLLARRRRAA